MGGREGRGREDEGEGREGEGGWGVGKGGGGRRGGRDNTITICMSSCKCLTSRFLQKL